MVKGIAEKLKATPAQVILAWGVQRGAVVVPKSEDNERMLQNINARRSGIR